LLSTQAIILFEYKQAGVSPDLSVLLEPCDQER